MKFDENEDYKRSYALVSHLIDEETYKKKYNASYKRMMAQWEPCMTTQIENYPEVIQGIISDEFYNLNLIYENTGIFMKLFIYPICVIHELLIDIPVRIYKVLSKNAKKPKFNPEEAYKLDRSKDVNGRGLNNIDYCIKKREEYNSLNDNYCPDKNKKATKVQAISSLRKYLYQNNFILKVNEVHRSMSFDFNEDLKSTFGKDILESVFGEKELNSNLEITFGKDINEALSIILPNIISLKNNYVEIKGSLKILEEKLSQLVQEEVKIEIVTDKVKNENGIKKKNSQLLINWDETISVIILAIGLIISRCIF